MKTIFASHKKRLCVVSMLLCSCGGNVYDSLVDKTGEAYNIAQARNLLDKEHYEEAQPFLDKVNDANQDKASLMISLKLGLAGLSFWKILLDVADAATSSSKTSSSSSGMDKIFDVISDSVFGTGALRTARVTALSESVLLLKSTNREDKKTKNFKCFLSGILVLPTVTDATSAIVTATNSLEDVQSTIVGSGDSAAQCPNLTGFQDALATLTTVQKNFDIILEQTTGCSFLAFLGENDSLNQAQVMLKKLSDGADKGCSTLTCTTGDLSCLALELPCVKSVLGASNATAGDGRIDNCEILQNCRTAGACF